MVFVGSSDDLCFWSFYLLGHKRGINRGGRRSINLGKDWSFIISVVDFFEGIKSLRHDFVQLKGRKEREEGRKFLDSDFKK